MIIHGTNNKNQFDWVDFYKELAAKLLHYKDNRDELLSTIRKTYDEIGINLPTLERENRLTDIDPFTVFGLFNKNLTEINRVKIISSFAKSFKISKPVPTSFDSIPVLNNQNATFYDFSDSRGASDIDDLWELFESALAYADNPSEQSRKKLSTYFDLTINKKGNGNSKITMGLYWIAPNSFLNLDKRNTWYIYESGKISAEFVQTLPTVEGKISSAKYFEIMEKLRVYLQSDASTLKDFKELSFEAWRYSEEVNREIREKKIQTERETKGAALADEDVETVHYWIYSPGDSAANWDEFYSAGIMAIGWDSIGNLKNFSNKEDMKQKMKDTIDPSKSYKNDAHTTWQFANDMNLGDIVFAKKGKSLIVGRGIVESDYEYDDARQYHKNVRKIKWTHKGEWPNPRQTAIKTLTDITSNIEYVKQLNALFDDDSGGDDDGRTIDYPAYDEEKFLEEVYMDKKNYKTLVALVRNKKNIILQGPPGVGKTFAAKRLAYSMMGVKDPNRVVMVQFHQSYSYEDFIMGYRPTEKGFELKRGVFYNFCKDAEIDSENEYFFIIDEINRGNLSKIFGELFMLIEGDKRGVELQLLYADEKFSVPANVYIIGMMNTADRSLAMLDYALRRRFAFFEMKPAFETEGFREYQTRLADEKFVSLIACVENLNAAISSDESLGEGFCIGHSYFCNLEDATEQNLSGIVEFELIPLLKEYWFDEPAKVRDWSNNLRSSIR